MKAFIKKHRIFIETVLTILGLLLFIIIFRPPCLMKYFTGFSCPGCGISRAIFAALKLNFEDAFSYHPIWFLILPASAISLMLYYVKREWIFYAFVGSYFAIYVGVWIVRIIMGDPVVQCDFTDGAIYKAFIWIGEQMPILFNR